MNRFDFLKDRHIGQSCILICNGPSLNKMDLSFLKHEMTIGLNKIYLGFKKFNFYPRYYVSINEKVIQQAQENIKNLNCVNFISQRSKQLIPESALTYHINTNELNQPKAFYKDISQGVNEGYTVTYAALQIAYFLGFKKVIIIGMDHHFTYSGKPNESKILEGKDINHFCEDYFGYGQTWDNPDLAHSEVFYKIAKKVFEEEGREIIDATYGGHCSIFKKMNYRDLFQL